MRFKAFLVSLILFLSLIGFVETIPNVNAQEASSFGLASIDANYNVSSGENSDYLYIKILQTSVGHFDEVERFESREFLGFDKNRRGFISFTNKGFYIADIVPVISSKIGPQWFVVPLVNVDNVHEYGSRYFDNGVEIFYSGNGSFTAYQYSKLSNQIPVNVSINKISIFVSNITGKAKLNVNVSSPDREMDDSGFGFLFKPLDPQKFRYVTYNTLNDTERQIDLLGLDHKIVNVTKAIHFMDEALNNLGIEWDWTKLFDEGPKKHFEIINIAGIKGILTGSYGFGPRAIDEPIIIDPTLTLSEDSNSLAIDNQWGNVGYNVSLSKTILRLESIYNYFVDNEMFDLGANGRIVSLVDLNAEASTWSGVLYPNNDILINDTDIIQIRRWNNSHTISSFGINHTYTFYRGKPEIIIHFETYNFTNTGDTINDVTFPYTINWDEDIDPNQDESLGDDYVGSYHANIGAFAIVFPYNFDVSTFVDGGADDVGCKNAGGDYGREFNFTALLSIRESLDAPGLNAWLEELDDDNCDGFPSIASVSGGTYQGRENISVSHEFERTGPDYNITFDITPENQETGDSNNFSIIWIVNWNVNNWTLEANDSKQNFDVDYYGFYNSTSGELIIILNFEFIGQTEIEIYYTVPINIPDTPNLLFGAGFNGTINGTIEIHWNHSMIYVYDFEIQNSSDGVTFTFLDNVSVTYYIDNSTELINGTYRYYRVRARNFTGGSYHNSSWSNTNLEKVYFNDRIGLTMALIFGDLNWLLAFIYATLLVVGFGMRSDNVKVIAGLVGVFFGIVLLTINGIFGFIMLILNIFLTFIALIER